MIDMQRHFMDKIAAKAVPGNNTPKPPKEKVKKEVAKPSMSRRTLNMQKRRDNMKNHTGIEAYNRKHKHYSDALAQRTKERDKMLNSDNFNEKDMARLENNLSYAQERMNRLNKKHDDAMLNGGIDSLKNVNFFDFQNEKNLEAGQRRAVATGKVIDEATVAADKYRARYGGLGGGIRSIYDDLANYTRGSANALTLGGSNLLLNNSDTVNDWSATTRRRAGDLRFLRGLGASKNAFLNGYGAWGSPDDANELSDTINSSDQYLRYMDKDHLTAKQRAKKGELNTRRIAGMTEATGMEQFGQGITDAGMLALSGAGIVNAARNSPRLAAIASSGGKLANSALRTAGKPAYAIGKGVFNAGKAVTKGGAKVATAAGNLASKAPGAGKVSKNVSNIISKIPKMKPDVKGQEALRSIIGGIQGNEKAVKTIKNSVGKGKNLVERARSILNPTSKFNPDIKPRAIGNGMVEGAKKLRRGVEYIANPFQQASNEVKLAGIPQTSIESMRNILKTKGSANATNLSRMLKLDNPGKTLLQLSESGAEGAKTVRQLLRDSKWANKGITNKILTTGARRGADTLRALDANNLYNGGTGTFWDASQGDIIDQQKRIAQGAEATALDESKKAATWEETRQLYNSDEETDKALGYRKDGKSDLGLSISSGFSGLANWAKGSPWLAAGAAYILYKLFSGGGGYQMGPMGGYSMGPMGGYNTGQQQGNIITNNPYLSTAAIGAGGLLAANYGAFGTAAKDWTNSFFGGNKTTTPAAAPKTKTEVREAKEAESRDKQLEDIDIMQRNLKQNSNPVV